MYQNTPPPHPVALIPSQDIHHLILYVPADNDPHTENTALTLCMLMDCSFWFDAINSGKSIVHNYLRVSGYN